MYFSPPFLCKSVHLNIEYRWLFGSKLLNGCYLLVVTEMVLNGATPPRGSAAAASSLRRRRTTSVGAAGGASGNMLQFYTDDVPGLKISPNVVLVMSIGFIAFVATLHVMGKLYFVQREA